MITVWRGTDGDLQPVKMECEGLAYPNLTSTGEQMWSNTHFKTEAEAWNSILKSVVSGIARAAGYVKGAQSALTAAQEQAGDAAVALVAAHDNYDRWSKERKA